jgi:hypothetical protein
VSFNTGRWSREPDHLGHRPVQALFAASDVPSTLGTRIRSSRRTPHVQAATKHAPEDSRNEARRKNQLLRETNLVEWGGGGAADRVKLTAHCLLVKKSARSVHTVHD